MRFIKSVPLAISGLALALAGLGNLLAVYSEWLRAFCGGLAAAILVLFALRVACDFSGAQAELKHPVPLSSLPTSTMALMLLSGYLQPDWGVGTLLWHGAVGAHFGIMFVFIIRFVVGFRLANVFPTWFVACVGMVTISVTAPTMGADTIGRAVFYAGFPLYFVVLALVAWRLVKVGEFPEPARPTRAIFTAPMSLLTVGYFSSFAGQSRGLVYLMAVIVLVSYLYVSVQMALHLLRLPFYPTFAAFGFPYVISATAFRALAGFFADRGVYVFLPIALISVWIAVGVVGYLLVRYLKFFKSKLTA